MAARAHAGQIRKGTSIPYLIHPVHVAFLLAGHGFDEDLVIAGLLHDPVEDAGVDLREIEEGFGSRVASLVRRLTKAEAHGDAARTWRASREGIIGVIREADRDLAAVKAADALHNASATLADARAFGAAVWMRFNAGAEDIVWYYDQIRRACAIHLEGHPLVVELEDVVRELAEAAGVRGYL